MKGKIVRFTEHLTEWNKLSYDSIVIDYRKGYNIRKHWNKKTKFIECPLIKIYWLNAPVEKPPSALVRMSIDWNMDPQYTFGFEENANNYVIEEWNEFKSEWYYLDIFEVLD